MEHKEVLMNVIVLIAKADILLLPFIFLKALYLADSQEMFLDINNLPILPSVLTVEKFTSYLEMCVYM